MRDRRPGIGLWFVIGVLSCLAGCATGPKATATSDELLYRVALDRSRPANVQLPAQLGRYTAGRARPMSVGRWTPDREDSRLFHLPLDGQNPQACYVVANAYGQLIPVRGSGQDRFTFTLPRHVQADTEMQQLRRVEGERNRMLNNAAAERRRYGEAQQWLTTSAYYRDGQCLQPAAPTPPPRPAAACDPSSAREHGEKVCWGSFALGYSCDKALEMMNETKSGLANLVGSVGCSALSSAAQGEQLTLGSWLSDVLIDGPTTRCLEGLSQGDNIAGNLLCSAIFLPLFIDKMNNCIAESASRCSGAYSAWARETNDAAEFPARLVATCQAHVQRVAAGSTPAATWDQQAAAYTPQIETARRNYEQARQAIGVVNLADYPCAK